MATANLAAAKQLAHSIVNALSITRSRANDHAGKVSRVETATENAISSGRIAPPMVCGGRERLDCFLESIVARCRELHPEATIACDWTGIVPGMDVFGEQSLRQALLALLNNTVDSSPERVHVAADCYANTLRIWIEDRGSGVQPGDREKLGTVFFTTKSLGCGAVLDLVAALRTIEGLRGSVCLESARERGTRVQVVFPLDALQLRPEA